MTDRAAPLVSCLAVAALAAAAPAAAEHDGLLGLRLDVHAHVHDVLRELGHVPERIHARHRAHLAAFFGGRTYYAPHRHHHASYRFPVRVDGAVVYRPYVYCDDVLFAPSGARFELWYGDPYAPAPYWCGHCHGYYPRGHAHFRYDSVRRYDVPAWRYRGDDHRRGYWRDAHRRGDHRWCDHGRGRWDRRHRNDDRDDDRRRHRHHDDD